MRKEQKAVKPTKPSSADISLYAVDELISSSEQAFGVKRECAAAALHLAKVTEVTKEQAGKLIDEFMRKEVF